ncbi:DNA polymerase III PolC-type [Tepidimonas alkaliphilus]|uniref:DNA-directed DNA polymerase n=1 Tax=Tepidimonas alkaliphilus TaxID=2588942 RepID=A0A554WDB2_9BURK|nr:3'-5' exonuclease [Tepidimonas alkaliphilus]TSE21552.1 DNA polymerase III PolC-type [Tepidimonas alkaliphilus]
MPRRFDPRWAWLLLGAAVVSLVWLAATVGLIALTLEPPARQRMLALLGDRWTLALLMWLLGMAAIAWGLQKAFEVAVHPWRRLAEEAAVRLTSPAAPALPERGPADVRRVARLFNELLRQRDEWRSEVQTRVREAARAIEQEKQRLAALMAELTQSVIVCNLDGRVLLYNQRARWQVRALSQAPAALAGAELLGLGRSIYAVLDRRLIAHALEELRQRLRKGAVQPSAQFVTATRSGQLLRVQVAPVRDLGDAGQGEGIRDPAALAGFVLLLDNITREYEQWQQALQRWNEALHKVEAEWADVAAAWQLAADGARSAEVQGALPQRLHALRQQLQQALRAAQAQAQAWVHWPAEELRGADLLAVLQRRLSQLEGLQVEVEPCALDEVVRVEPLGLAHALAGVLQRLCNHRPNHGACLRLRALQGDSGCIRLEAVWPQPAGADWPLHAWLEEADAAPLSLRERLQPFGGGCRWQLDEEGLRLCLDLPLAPHPAPPPPEMPITSRPEFYDFDLFSSTPAALAWDERPLASLSYTVFDTETTGLQPSKGDQILQIGATRIVNGRLLRHESFEQLIDPQRPIPPESTAIHGITPAMVRGQPTIEQVLPAFHAFARDTVLVAHNAAFDLRFLQLKARSAGVTFDQPVLDTLLLSAVVHPQQPSHSLEAIAARLGIPVLGRHTALGDALVTAEVFLRLIPLLEKQGIVTLGQARRAAERTYYARLTY